MIQHIAQSKATSGVAWLQDLEAAIKTGDDHALWRVMGEHADPHEAHSTLATQVCRLAYRVADRARFSEMFLVPVIQAPGSALLQNPQAWRQADYCIGEAIDSWLPARTRKTVFAGIRPYEWIGTWRPAVVQRHLTSTVPGADRGKVSFLTEKLDLPLEASRLGFISMVLTSEMGWPQLPAADTLRDNRFKKVVAGALQDTPAAPTVLAPDHMQYAVADGLCLWLRHLSDEVEVTGWTASPVASTPDVVKVTLTFDHEQVPFTQFTVRKHQLGLAGLDQLFVTLEDVADKIDRPMDIAIAAPKVQMVDLT